MIARIEAACPVGVNVSRGRRGSLPTLFANSQPRPDCWSKVPSKQGPRHWLPHRRLTSSSPLPDYRHFCNRVLRQPWRRCPFGSSSETAVAPNTGPDAQP